MPFRRIAPHHCSTRARLHLWGRRNKVIGVSPSFPPASHHHWRSFSSDQAATEAFDRRIKTLQRNNAARSHRLWRDDPESVNYDYLRTEIASRLVDRLDDIKREEGFPLALDIGAGAGYIHRAICAEDALRGEGGIGGVRKIVQLDSAKEALHRDEDLDFSGSDRCGSYRLVQDEEDTLPFPDGTFDLVISSMSMHWINKLPQLFAEVSRVLKPDGCFMFAMVGGETLSELRASMVLGELERDGGVSPHIGPFVELSDTGALLQRAGFALPTLDIDTMRIAYPSAPVLMEHLQRMGESNAGLKRRDRVSLDTFLASSCIYESQFGVDGHDEIEATLQIIYAIGWTPHESQQKPKERGSATHKIGDIVEFSKQE